MRIVKHANENFSTLTDSIKTCKFLMKIEASLSCTHADIFIIPKVVRIFVLGNKEV